MCDESMDCSSVTNETGRERQLADKDDLEKPRKPAKPGTSKEATPSAQPKPKRIPPIVAKVKEVETAFTNALRAQTRGLVNFEYTQGGLKIRTSVEADHTAVVTFLRDRGMKFFTFNPSSIHQMRYVLRGLPPSTDRDEIIAGIRERA